MTPYTVVLSDSGRHDTGFRGTDWYWQFARRFGGYGELALYWFLCEHFGSQCVRLMQPSQLLQENSIHTTDWLFVGLPTRLNGRHLNSVRYRRVVLYDSTDFDGINFDYSDERFLLSLTDRCLKNWRDRRWKSELNVGLLPIKSRKLPSALRMQAVRTKLGMSCQKRFDVGMVSRIVSLSASHPRVKWLVELRHARPDLAIWGGLIPSGNVWSQIQHSPEAAKLQPCVLNRRRVGFHEYFRGLCQSKVALAPPGNAPWTYRHYEAIYARTLVVTHDMSNYELLVPLPREALFEIPEGSSVVPGVEQALQRYHACPDVVDSNLDEMNRWLEAGANSRRRPELLDRFFGQFPARLAS